MRDEFGGLFALSPGTLRRDPTVQEMAGGLECGAAGKEFWNEIIFSESSLLAEAASAVKASGQTIDETKTTQLSQALSRGIFVSFGGTANALTAAIPGGIIWPGLLPGMEFSGFVGTANTGAVTVEITGLTTPTGALPLLRRDGSVMQAGDVAANRRLKIFYDAIANCFRASTPVASEIAPASDTSAKSLIVPGASNSVPSYSGRTKLTNFGTPDNAAGGKLTWDATNAKLNVVTAGVYVVSMRFAQNLVAGVNYSFWAGMFRNGLTQSDLEVDQTNSSITYFGVGGGTSRVMRLSAGDYFEMFGSHNYGTGTTLNFYIDVAAVYIGS